MKRIAMSFKFILALLVGTMTAWGQTSLVDASDQIHSIRVSCHGPSHSDRFKGLTKERNRKEVVGALEVCVMRHLDQSGEYSRHFIRSPSEDQDPVTRWAAIRTYFDITRFLTEVRERETDQICQKIIVNTVQLLEGEQANLSKWFL